MPRRIPDFPDAYAQWNWIASVGSMISVISGLLVVYIIFDSFIKKKKAENYYWLVPDFFSDYNKKNMQTQTQSYLNYRNHWTYRGNSISLSICIWKIGNSSRHSR
jgi:heme/copper-type cytochrome/quinol oxidase subunit 1